jgi:hypothetical protein
MKESRKEFIKKAHSAACNEWKKNIEKEFPKLFKEDALEVGKWYKRKQDSRLWFVTHIKNGSSYGYGFDYSGYWADESKGFNYSLELNKATDKEVREALIKEAERRGFFNIGNTFKSCFDDNNEVRTISKYNSSTDIGYYYDKVDNELRSEGLNTYGKFCSNPLIYSKGKWATIVETITKEQAEKELGKTILN